MFSSYTLETVLATTSVALLVTALYLHVRAKRLERILKEEAARSERVSQQLAGENTELQVVNEEQQKLLESRGDFVAIVSHQLRTPATEIRWGIGELRDNPEWKFTPEQLEFVERLYASSQWMVNLIDRLVKLVNYDQKTPAQSVAPYEPDVEVRMGVEQIKTIFPQKHITLELDLDYDSTLATIDPDSLKIIVSNLVDNAFHYTPDGGSVTVRTLRSEKGAFVLQVSDSGIGISEEKQKTMYTKFDRDARAVALNEKGMGLGLYVVKKIIEQRGGTIDFETEEGKGTTFTVTIPAV